jgi:hypothetical protein
MQQLPLMQGHTGGTAEVVEHWEAHAKYDVGLLIARYVQQHPAPTGSSVAPRLEATGLDLQAAGEQHLDRLGLRRLSVH